MIAIREPGIEAKNPKQALKLPTLQDALEAVAKSLLNGSVYRDTTYGRLERAFEEQGWSHVQGNCLPIVPDTEMEEIPIQGSEEIGKLLVKHDSHRRKNTRFVVNLSNGKSFSISNSFLKEFGASHVLFLDSRPGDNGSVDSSWGATEVPSASQFVASNNEKGSFSVMKALHDISVDIYMYRAFFECMKSSNWKKDFNEIKSAFIAKKGLKCPYAKSPSQASCMPLTACARTTVRSSDSIELTLDEARNSVALWLELVQFVKEQNPIPSVGLWNAFQQQVGQQRPELKGQLSKGQLSLVLNKLPSGLYWFVVTARSPEKSTEIHSVMRTINTARSSLFQRLELDVPTYESDSDWITGRWTFLKSNDSISKLSNSCHILRVVVGRVSKT